MTRLTTIIGICTVITIGLLGAAFDEPEPTLDQRVYCEHVKAWYASHGAEGWPDYLNTYEDSCP